jgi:hypothetical protein
LLLPRDRSKTLTALAGAEPSMQRKLQLFNIRYRDNVLPCIAQLGAPVLVGYDPRNLPRVP